MTPERLEYVLGKLEEIEALDRLLRRQDRRLEVLSSRDAPLFEAAAMDAQAASVDAVTGQPTDATRAIVNGINPPDAKLKRPAGVEQTAS